MQSAIDLVPSTAPVTTTNRLGAQLSAREVVHLFPAQVGAHWAVLNLRDLSNTSEWIGPTPFETALRRLQADPKWRLIFDREDVRGYRKRFGGVRSASTSRYKPVGVQAMAIEHR